MAGADQPCGLWSSAPTGPLSGNAPPASAPGLACRPTVFAGKQCRMRFNPGGSRRFTPQTVDDIILLAPAVSANHGLRPAPRASRRGLDVLYSQRDSFCLGVLTRLVGTCDRRWGPAEDDMASTSPVPAQKMHSLQVNCGSIPGNATIGSWAIAAAIMGAIRLLYSAAVCGCSCNLLLLQPVAQRQLLPDPRLFTMKEVAFVLNPREILPYRLS
jgi:hypothetical protein